MPRVTSPTTLLATLAVGLTLGLALGQRAPILSAQLPSPPVLVAAPPAAPDVPTRTGDSEAIYRELDAQYELFAQVDRTFALVSRAVAPSVVHLVARKPRPAADGRRVARFDEETGSGVIVRPTVGSSLCVLTNHHVIAGADPADIAITLHDGRVLRPARAWGDPKADIAVLELGRDDLPAARIGDSDQAIVGTWVLALGSPFGLTHSISHGIISARNRHEEELESEGVENQEFLQTDAAINPGNSGGPLVNLRGEVIGINTAIASSGGGSEGVGFSVPINLARWIMDELVANGGRVNRGALGVRLQDVHAQRALELGLDRPRGARILSVQDSSPAAKAGIRDGDVVLRFNGIEILDINHFINVVSMTPIGQSVEVTLWRDRQPLASRVTIASRESLMEIDATGLTLPAVDSSSRLGRRPGETVPVPDSVRRRESGIPPVEGPRP